MPQFGDTENGASGKGPRQQKRQKVSGRHVCRTKLTREIWFSRHDFSRDKCSEIFPSIFEPFFCGSEKIRKIPAKFPANLSSPKSKKSTDELLQTSKVVKNCQNVFLSHVQQTVSGKTTSQYSPDTISWTLFQCSLNLA